MARTASSDSSRLRMLSAVLIAQTVRPRKFGQGYARLRACKPSAAGRWIRLHRAPSTAHFDTTRTCHGGG
jgi:hypothetical protein